VHSAWAGELDKAMARLALLSSRLERPDSLKRPATEREWERDIKILHGNLTGAHGVRPGTEQGEILIGGGVKHHRINFTGACN
jgi:hypothetical protein